MEHTDKTLFNGLIALATPRDLPGATPFHD
jgi:hypothetical protein